MDRLHKRSDSNTNQQGGTAENGREKGLTGLKRDKTSRSKKETVPTIPGAPDTPSLVPGATAGSGGAAPSVVGGGSGGGGEGGARFFKGDGAEVTVKGPENYEPIFDRKLEYKNETVPEAGEPVDLEPLTVKELLQLVYMSTNWNILATEAVLEVKLNAWTYETTPKQALQILEFNDVYYTFDEASKYLRVMTKEEWLDKEYGKTQESVFKIQHADIAYAESVINSMISEIGRSVTDERTNTIYVWDTADNLEMMQKALKDTDVPMQELELNIQYAEIGDVEPVIKELLSAAGSMVADPRTGRILVWDNTQNLDKVHDAIEKLDVPVESRSFNVTNVNAEDLSDSIEAMLSERGMMQIDPRYNALIITDLPKHLDRMGAVIRDLDKKLETRTWTLNYADIDFVSDSVESLIPPEMGEILVNEDKHQVTVTGLPDRLARVDDLIKTWDVRRKQVDIEAFIVGMTSDVERMFKVDWTYFDSNGNTPISVNGGAGAGAEMASAAGSGETASFGQLPMAIPAVGPLQLDATGHIVRPILENIKGGTVIDKITGNNLSVALSYLDQQKKLTVLASPRVIVQDNEEALFQNVTKVPYISATSYYNNSTVGVPNNNQGGNLNNFNNPNNTNRVEFVDVGTVLAVLPRITEENNILLDIRAEDSTFIDKTIVSNDQKSTIPEVTVREAQTQLRVNSGATIVMGGLRRDSAMDAVTKTPFLGDLPVLGKLFRNPNKKAEHSNLMIFITTTVIGEDTSPDTEALARAEYEIADFSRYNKKDFWGRLQSRLAEGDDEISVSIGQNGNLFSEGERIGMDELKAVFFKASKEYKPRLVLRKHPKAPDSVLVEITEAAMEAGLKVENDYSTTPVVPVYATDVEVSSPPPPANSVNK